LTIEAYRQILLVEPVLHNGAQFAVVLAKSNQLIGDIYLKEETDGVWLGYTIAPAFARQGFAAEAIHSVLTHLKEIGQSTVYAGVEPANLASVGLLEKLGFTYLDMDEHGEKIYRLSLN
jgi:ribosomal-protein-alanine N-acetyltransferase